MALLAEGILKTHWDQSVPVNLARIAKAMKLVVRLDDPGNACAVLEIESPGRAHVTIGKAHPIARQRYGVAHAMAHLALHHLRPGMRRPIHISGDYRVDHNQAQDSEANDFALRLLMPEPALRQAVQQVRSIKHLAKQFEVAEILVKQRMADLDLEMPRTLAQKLDPAITWD